MTDADAITLINGKADDLANEKSALTSARDGFNTTKQEVSDVLPEVDKALSSMERHVVYAMEFFGG